MKFELEIVKLSADVVATSSGCDPELKEQGFDEG